MARITDCEIRVDGQTVEYRVAADAPFKSVTVGIKAGTQHDNKHVAVQPPANRHTSSVTTQYPQAIDYVSVTVVFLDETSDTVATKNPPPPRQWVRLR